VSTPWDEKKRSWPEIDRSPSIRSAWYLSFLGNSWMNLAGGWCTVEGIQIMSADDWANLKKEICTQFADPPGKQHWTKIRHAAPGFILTVNYVLFVIPALHS
jgi:hypothetical protein